MLRIAAIAMALLLAGCADETVLRLSLDAAPGVAPTRLTLTVGDKTKTITPVTLPGTVVIVGLPARQTVCLDVYAYDASGALVGQAGTDVAIVPPTATTTHLTLTPDGATCSPVLTDLGTVGDMGDLAGGGAVAVCPANALFCDDFETGTLDKWSQHGVKYGDMGTIAPSMTRAAHGAWSVEANASGASGMANYAEVEEDFTPRVAPPVAVRANVWSGQPLTGYTIVLSVYDDNANGLSLGANGSGRWVVTEDQATVADHNSTVATTAGWHCLELVVDGGGMVSAYVDGALVIGPFARNSTLPYGAFIFGIDRTVQAATDLFVDDVAIAPTRLYCP